MKLLAAILLAFGGPAFAGECVLGAPGSDRPGMSVVAPEMQQSSPSDRLCVPVGEALARIHAQQAVASASAPGAYVKRTEFDNSPWRFHMSQDGRRMTAAEFDAWMKARGLRVATGKPAASAERPPPPLPPPPPPSGD